MSQGGGGLGFIDAASPVLDLSFTLLPPLVQPTSPSFPPASGPSSVSKALATRPTVKPQRKRRQSKTSKDRPKDEVRISLQCAQDPHALRHRPGDTGSVAWRASVLFAELLWSYHLFPHTSNPATLEEEDVPFLDVEKFRRSKVLELGCGTGSLAMACRDLVEPSTSKWTASDQFDNLKLVRKTFSLNGVSPSSGSGPFKIEEVDWVDIARSRARGKSRTASDGGDEKYDIILATDCLFNESLVLPFLHTISYYSHPLSEPPSSMGGTLVIVVSELRSPEVFRLFLDEWIRLDEGSWKVVRIEKGGLGGGRGLGLAGRKYGVWCGWKTVS